MRPRTFKEKAKDLEPGDIILHYGGMMMEVVAVSRLGPGKTATVKIEANIDTPEGPKPTEMWCGPDSTYDILEDGDG